MEEDQGKKNKGFLKKFVSKKVLREKLQEQRNAKTDARKEWSEKVATEAEKKKNRWKSSSPITNPQNFHKYQEKAYQNISEGNQSKISSSNVSLLPLSKEKLYDFNKVKPESCTYCHKGFKNKEEKEEHEKEHLLKEKLTKEKTAKTYKGIAYASKRP